MRADDIKVTIELDTEHAIEKMEAALEAAFEALGRRLLKPTFMLETEELETAWGVPWWFLVAAGAVGGLAALLVVVGGELG